MTSTSSQHSSSQRRVGRDIHDTTAQQQALRPLPDMLFFAGMLLFVTGERGFAVSDAHLPFLATSLLLLTASLAMRVKTMLQVPSVKGVQMTFVALFAPLMVGGVLYALSLDDTREAAATMKVAGIVLLLATTFLHGVVTWAVRPMAQSGWLEPRRLRTALLAGTSFIMAVTGLGLVNYVVRQNEWRSDFATTGPTKPSTSTSTLWATKTTDVEVFLFFAKGNPLLNDVEDYFKTLDPNLQLNVLDPAEDPELSKAMKVSRQGTVALRVGERSEKAFIGKSRKDQKRGLKKLDKEVRTRLARLTRDEAAVHFTVGHQERKGTKAGKKARPGTSAFRARLKEYNAKAKNLGLQEGLGNSIGDDVNLVAVVGPRAPFLDEEVAALKEYVDRGGALLLSLDPTAKHGLQPLLQHIGLTLSTTEAVSDRVFLRQTNTRADHALLPSNRFSSHKVTKALKKREDGMVVFAGVGHLDRVPRAQRNKKSSVTFVSRSHDSTFLDEVRNRAFDKDKEKRGVKNFIAAVEHAGPAVDGKEPPKARVVVIADSEVFADGLWAVTGNQTLATETVLWLLGDDRVEGEVVTDTDVEIKHTRDEDVVWFYSTVFGAPLLALGLGAVLIGRRKKKRGQR